MVSPAPTPADSRPSTPALDNDDLLLRQLSVIIIDSQTLQRLLEEMYHSTIIHQLPAVYPDEENTPLSALKHATASVTSLVPSLLSQIATILVRQMAEPLKASIRTVASEVRASNRSNAPTEASHFIPRVLRPIRAYFEGSGSRIDSTSRTRLATEVLDEIAVR